MKNSVLNVSVSWYHSVTSSRPAGKISLREWLTSDVGIGLSEKVREALLPEQVSSFKKQCPAVTPSGVFKTRKERDLIRHSGLICIDIDGKDNPHIEDWIKCKNILSKVSNVAYAGLSISGNGIFCIIPISHTSKHAAHFTAIQTYFEGALGIIVDKACKDISRLRVISYDPQPYINDQADVLERVIEFESAPTNLVDDYNSITKDKLTVKHLCLKICAQKVDITENYFDWFRIGCVIANTFGIDGLNLYHKVSQFYPNYSPASCENQFYACLKKKYDYSLGSLIHVARKYEISI